METVNLSDYRPDNDVVLVGEVLLDNWHRFQLVSVGETKLMMLLGVGAVVMIVFLGEAIFKKSKKRAVNFLQIFLRLAIVVF